MSEPKKMALIASQGTLDWAYPPFILASTAAAMDMEVQIFFTFYGLTLLKKEINAKAMALLARAYLRLFNNSKDVTYKKLAMECLDWLEKNSSPDYSGKCWGYPFDWMTNRGLWTKDLPLITSTPYVFEAFLALYDVTKEQKYLDVATKTLAFLIDVHFIDGIYVPIGQAGWFHKEGERSHFDQQPEDTSSMIQVLRQMYDITKNVDYYELMHKAFCWFLGDNAMKQMVYDEITGGCCDGIHKTGVNLNQGAESTVSYLIARLQFDEAIYRNHRNIIEK